MITITISITISRLPRCEIESSVEVLTTGKFQRLPQQMIPFLRNAPFEKTKTRLIQLFQQLNEHGSSSSSSSRLSPSGANEITEESTICELIEALKDERVIKQLTEEEKSRADEIRLFFEHMDVLTKSRILQSNIPAAFSQITFGLFPSHLSLLNE